jgi:hypothetical protein
MRFEITPEAFLGPNGTLSIGTDDEVSLKLGMLIKGECGPGGPSRAAEEFGFSRQRYFQLRTLFHEQGAAGLVSQKRGPKTNYRRTREAVCQTVRYRFLDPEISSEVIAQKLRQTHFDISARSVDRILEEFGLQKKTLSVSSGPTTPVSRDVSHAAKKPRRARRSSQSRTRGSPTAGG